MIIRWTDPAVEDLEAVYDYIARDNEDKAVQVIAELLLAVEGLERFPKWDKLIPRFPAGAS